MSSRFCFASTPQKALAAFICYSLVQVSLAPLVMAGERRPLLSPSTVRSMGQDGARPRSGAPEGVFPNLDDVKSRPSVRPRAPQAIPSTKRARRKPLVPRNGRRVGDPLPIPSPIRASSIASYLAPSFTSPVTIAAGRVSRRGAGHDW